MAEAAAAHLRRGLERSSAGDWPAALAAYDAALAEDPALAAAHFHRGVTLISLDRPAEALASLDRALALHDDWRCHHFRALALQQTGRLATAIEAFDAALARSPREADTLMARGLAKLALGRFAAGWPDYETRWAARSFAGSSDASIPADLRVRLGRSPRLEDLAGKRVLIVGEQGVGDVLMFASLLPDLIAIAADVTLACESRLHRLFAASFEGLRLTDMPGAERWGADAVLAIGSLAGLFRNDPTAFPGRAYLAASHEATARAAALLGPRRAKLRVGLSWRGGSQRTRRTSRSIPLASLTAITARDDLDIVSLQYGDVAAEIEAANRTLPRPILVPPPGAMADFDDLAGLVSQMDVVLSVQTSLVHLSGAMGQRCVVLVPHVAEWRYGASGASMPWYGSVTLVRQTASDAWEEAIAQANDQLSGTRAD